MTLAELNVKIGAPLKELKRQMGKAEGLVEAYADKTERAASRSEEALEEVGRAAESLTGDLRELKGAMRSIDGSRINFTAVSQGADAAASSTLGLVAALTATQSAMSGVQASSNTLFSGVGSSARKLNTVVRDKISLLREWAEWKEKAANMDVLSQQRRYNTTKKGVNYWRNADHLGPAARGLTAGIAQKSVDKARRKLFKDDLKLKYRKAVAAVSRVPSRLSALGSSFSASGASGAAGAIVAAWSAAAAAAEAAMAATAATVGAITGGFTLIGLVAAAQADKVQSAFKALADSVGKDMMALTRPIQGVLISIARRLRTAFTAISPDLADVFARVSMYVDQVASALLPLAVSVMPAFRMIVEKTAPIVDAFAKGLASMAPAINQFLQGVSNGIPGVTQSVGHLFDTFRELLPYLGKLIGKMAQLAGPVTNFLAESFEALVKLIGGFTSVMGTFLGQSMPGLKSFFGALGDLGSAVADVFRALSPVFRQATGVVAFALNQLGTLVGGALRAIADAIRLFLNLMTDDWSAAWKSLKGVVAVVFKSIANVILSVLARIIESLANFLGYLPGVGDKIETTFRHAAEGLRSLKYEIGGEAEEIDYQLSAIGESFLDMGKKAEEGTRRAIEAVKAVALAPLDKLKVEVEIPDTAKTYHEHWRPLFAGASKAADAYKEMGRIAEAALEGASRATADLLLATVGLSGRIDSIGDAFDALGRIAVRALRNVIAELIQAKIQAVVLKQVLGGGSILGNIIGIAKGIFSGVEILGRGTGGVGAGGIPTPSFPSPGRPSFARTNIPSEITLKAQGGDLIAVIDTQRAKYNRIGR